LQCGGIENFLAPVAVRGRGLPIRQRLDHRGEFEEWGLVAHTEGFKPIADVAFLRALLPHLADVEHAHALGNTVQ
jgi:hypothetical protein